MEIEELAITVAEFKGEFRAFREVFGQHNQQEASRYDTLSKSVTEMDEKIDKLLLREASIRGEFKGMRNVAIAMATAVSALIAVASWAAPYLVG